MSENTTANKKPAPTDLPVPNGHGSNGVTAHEGGDAPASTSAVKKRQKKKPAAKAGAAPKAARAAKTANAAPAAPAPHEAQAADPAPQGVEIPTHEPTPAPTLEATTAVVTASTEETPPAASAPEAAPQTAPAAPTPETAPQAVPAAPAPEATPPALRPGDRVMRDGMRYRVHAISPDGLQAQVVNADGLYTVFTVDSLAPDTEQPSETPAEALRLRIKVWTDPNTSKRYVVPSAFMRDVVNGQPVSDVMYAYAMSDEETKLVLLRAHEWNTLPFYYFHEGDPAPRATTRPLDVVVSGGRPS